MFVLYGLLSGMDELLPNVEQRFCMRYLYNNFRNKYPKKLLNEIIWKAAKSTCPQAWKREMNGIRMVNKEYFKHMMKTPLRFWSKSYFRTQLKCDSALNNMSGAFNIVIIESRVRPLVTLPEEIKTYLMENLAGNRM